MLSNNLRRDHSRTKISLSPSPPPPPLSLSFILNENYLGKSLVIHVIRYSGWWVTPARRHPSGKRRFPGLIARLALLRAPKNRIKFLQKIRPEIGLESSTVFPAAARLSLTSYRCISHAVETELVGYSINDVLRGRTHTPRNAKVQNTYTHIVTHTYTQTYEQSHMYRQTPTHVHIYV